MQSFVMGLFFFVQSAGSLLGGVLFELCSLGKNAWTPKITQADREVSRLHGRLEYYFFLLAGILFFTWIIFISITLRFKLSLINRTRKGQFM